MRYVKSLFRNIQNQYNISKSTKGFNVRFSTYYFHIKTIDRFSNLHQYNFFCFILDFYFCSKLCILTNLRVLISNITTVFQIYRSKYSNKAFLIPFVVVAVIVVVLLDSWYLDKFEGVDFKYDISFFKFQSKILKKGFFGPNLRFFIFAQNFSFWTF